MALDPGSFFRDLLTQSFCKAKPFLRLWQRITKELFMFGVIKFDNEKKSNLKFFLVRRNIPV